MTGNDQKQKQLIGAWIDAIGTIISAGAEVRSLVGLNDINNQILSIGEGLQAFGTFLAATDESDDPLNFAGNWIDGIGAATSSFAAYLQHIDEVDSVNNTRLEVLGDTLQSLGASMSSLADYLSGDNLYAIGNALQGLGAGLEAIGGVFELKERKEAQPLSTLGAILQSIGSNFNALLITKEVLDNTYSLPQSSEHMNNEKKDKTTRFYPLNDKLYLL